MVFKSFLLGTEHKRDGVENKPASLLVVSLGKALNGMPPSLCGRQVVKRADEKLHQKLTRRQDGILEMATPKRERISTLKDSDIFRFLMNGGQKHGTIK